MNQEQFEKNSKELLAHCWSLLGSKGKEYSSHYDKLANFRQVTSLMNTNEAQVCFWYSLKHIASIAKIVKDIDRGNLPSAEVLLEKVGDATNYMVLLYSCVKDIQQQHLISKGK